MNEKERVDIDHSSSELNIVDSNPDFSKFPSLKSYSFPYMVDISKENVEAIVRNETNDFPDVRAQITGEHPSNCKCSRCKPVGGEVPVSKCCDQFPDLVKHREQFQPTKANYQFAKHTNYVEQDKHLRELMKSLGPGELGDHPLGDTGADEAIDNWLEKQPKPEAAVGLKMAINKEFVLKGLVLWYINIGQIPSDKAEAFVKRFKEGVIGDVTSRFPDGWESLYIPTRERTTGVEMLRFDV